MYYFDDPAKCMSMEVTYQHCNLTQSVTKLLGIISLVTGLDNDSLSAGESAGEHNHNFTVLDAVKRKARNNSTTKIRL